jgi:hypothetical protein
MGVANNHFWAHTNVKVCHTKKRWFGGLVLRFTSNYVVIFVSSLNLFSFLWHAFKRIIMFGVHGYNEVSWKGNNAKTPLMFTFDLCLHELEVHAKWPIMHKA